MGIEEIIVFLESTNDIAVAIRLVMATLFGSLIGWERIVKRHSAGIKTFALVSLGSAVATALNIYLAMIPGLEADVSRIPAGVVSGIGFLGAGTILVTGRKQIKGLTTAASLWVASCMGMAIGAGYITIGITCFVLVMIANVVLMRLSQRVEEHSPYMSIYVEVDKAHGVPRLMQALSEAGCKVSSMTKTKEKTIQSADTALMIDLDLEHHRKHQEIMAMLNSLEFVNYVEEV